MSRPLCAGRWREHGAGADSRLDRRRRRHPVGPARLCRAGDLPDRAGDLARHSRSRLRAADAIDRARHHQPAHRRGALCADAARRDRPPRSDAAEDRRRAVRRAQDRADRRHAHAGVGAMGAGIDGFPEFAPRRLLRLRGRRGHGLALLDRRRDPALRARACSDALAAGLARRQVPADDHARHRPAQFDHHGGGLCRLCRCGGDRLLLAGSQPRSD